MGFEIGGHEKKYRRRRSPLTLAGAVAAALSGAPDGHAESITQLQGEDTNTVESVDVRPGLSGVEFEQYEEVTEFIRNFTGASSDLTRTLMHRGDNPGIFYSISPNAVAAVSLDILNGDETLAMNLAPAIVFSFGTYAESESATDVMFTALEVSGDWSNFAWALEYVQDEIPIWMGMVMERMAGSLDSETFFLR